MEFISRRDLLRLAGLGLASSYIGGCAGRAISSLGEPRSDTFDPFEAMSPIQRDLSDSAPLVFSGDYQPERAHKMLWNKPSYLNESHGGKWPDPTETAEVVVIGGGMSGLLTAYQLRDLKPVVLERHPRFGGNSRGESWRGIEYSLATAYFTVPDAESPIRRFFTEVGIDKLYRVRSTNDPVFVEGVRYDDIWARGTVPESRAQFTKLEKHLQDVLGGKNGQKYPEIPIVDPADRERIARLDRRTFHDYVVDVVGGPLHPHLERVVEHYFWSASACSASEVSAAGGLNFFAADFGSMAITPGGNGAIAEAVLRKLHQSLPAGRLRPGSTVLDVKVDDKGAIVHYVDSSEHLKAVRARAVVMACPKFVAAKIIDDLEPVRRKAIAKLRYRSYLLANLLVNKPIKDDFYDLFFFGNEREVASDRRASAVKQRVTDLVYGNYAKVDPERTVLTLFRGFPYDGARYSLYAGTAYADYRREFGEQISGSILPLLGLKPFEVADVRLTRWGHPLPLNAAGLIGDGTIDAIRKPFRKRVFFVEQDNWMLPSFETCFGEASHWAPLVRKALA